MLFKRWPMLRWRPKEHEQIVRLAAQAKAPAFANDFALLETVLMPHFRAYDNAALRGQNQFQRAQVFLIFGGMLATILGAVQIATGDAAWPGMVETGLTIALAAIALRAHYVKAQEHYLTNRLKAETLRGEYFLFLARIGDYADEQLCVQQLRERIARIQAEKRRA